jgi:crotonobetainyl-CoA:carnitine CoA-transferase CaiB-like acyl-CoA transferase
MGSKWNTSLTSLRPLAGVRVLSMEQAAALPFATRHLADLGADVIRVQSHKRPAPDSYDIEFTRNKRQLAIDLATPGGPDAFRRVAAACDIVCHNFTPQVVRKFGIDYESLRALRPDIIYLELTGFGTDGPWRSRPLFGPGAEALAGHNLLIGDPDQWPGRPATITYADNTCGLYTVLALTDALARRDRQGTGSHLDISLYET